MKEKKNVKKEEKVENKIRKIIAIIVIVLLLAIIIWAIFYAIPKLKFEGIDGILHPIKLSQEEQSYYDLFEKELVKYVEYEEKDYSIVSQVYYFEKIDSPVITIAHRYSGDYTYYPKNKVTIYYIKDGKLIKKEYASTSEIQVLYNVERNETNYYLYQAEDMMTSTSTYTLLEDIVSEKEDPYVVTFVYGDDITVRSSTGGKMSIPKWNAVFSKDLIGSLDGRFSSRNPYFEDGIGYLKADIKKCVLKENKIYLKDIITSMVMSDIDEHLNKYGLKRGQSILTSANFKAGVISNNNTQTTTTTKPSVNDNTTSTTQKAKSKCNSGFVYVDFEKRCYSSTDVKDVTSRCESGETEIGGNCETTVNKSLCSSGNEDYIETGGYCIDKNKSHSMEIGCPSGYGILWGEYSGKTFEGECYKYMKPNN